MPHPRIFAQGTTIMIEVTPPGFSMPMLTPVAHCSDPAHATEVSLRANGFAHLKQAVEHALLTFDGYAQQDDAKGTDEGAAKAQFNRNHADVMRTALAIASGATPAS